MAHKMTLRGLIGELPSSIDGRFPVGCRGALFRGLVPIVLPVFVGAVLLARPERAEADSNIWNGYAGSSSVFVSYAGYAYSQQGTFPGSPELHLSVNDSSGTGTALPLTAIMDTGSTGLVISLHQACTSFLTCQGNASSNYVPSAGAAIGYTTMTYTSDGTSYFGFYTNAQVSIADKNNTQAATAQVPVFVAVSLAGQSQQTSPAPDTIAQFGIGFGRGSADGVALTDANGRPNGVTIYGKSLNAFMNLTSLNGVGNLASVAPGYVVTKDGVYLGLSSTLGLPATINGPLLALTPVAQSPSSNVSSYATAATKNDWQTPPMVLAVAGNTSSVGVNGHYYGTMLVDTGVLDAILVTGGGRSTNQALVTSSTVTNMTLGLPGITASNGAGVSQFTYVYQGICQSGQTNASNQVINSGCGPTSEGLQAYNAQNGQIIPLYPISSQDSSTKGYASTNTGFADATATPTPFLNTGANFLNYFNIVYDPVSGFIGYLPNGTTSAPANVLSVTPMFALQGNQVIPDGTNVGLPIYLYTAIGNQTVQRYVPVDVVLSAASSSGQVTISQPILSDTIANCVLANCSTGLVIDQGTFLFTAANSYTGATTISRGATLGLGANGSIPNSFALTANGTFDISGTAAGASITSLSGAGIVSLGAQTLTLTNASGTFSGVIADSGLSGGSGGGLSIVGGKEILTGVSTYTGATAVTGATLEVDGAIGNTSGVTVNAGGVLSGTGLIDPTTTTITSGGTLAPGSSSNPTGTLSITGNLVFQSAATYLVSIAGTSASNTLVSGTASLAGTVAVSVMSLQLARSYDILSSAGLGGTAFDSAVSSNPNFAASLGYTPSDVFLNVTAQLGAGSALAANQQSVANGISSYFNSGGALPSGFANLFGMTGGALANSLAQLDGEAATGAARGASALTTEFLTLMLDPFVNGRGNAGNTGVGALGFAPEDHAGLPEDVARAYAAILGKAQPKPTFERRWSTWGATYGGSSYAAGDPAAGSNNVTASTYGSSAGMDYRLSPSIVVGFALGGAGTNWGLANALGSGRSDAMQAGVYGVGWLGSAYLAGALAFSNHWFNTHRAAIGDQLTAKFDGQSYGARLEGGYRYAVSTFGVTPYAAVQFQDFHTPAYSESDPTGAGFGLSYGAMNATDLRTELGSRVDAPTLLNGKPLVVYGRAAWAHEFVSSPVVNAAFESLPGAGFTVAGAPIPHDAAVTSVGAQLFMNANWSLTAKFDGEFASGAQTYAGSGTLRYTW